MLNELKNAMENGKCVSIYANHNDISKFIWGKILCINDESVAVAMLSPEGEYDGIAVKSIDDIIYFEIDTEYSNNLENLYGKNFSLVPNISFDDDIKKSVLLNAMETQKIVSLEMLKSGYYDVYGLVEKVDEEICKIKAYNNSDLDDGFAFVRIDAITDISYDSQDEQKLLKKIKGD